MMYTNEMTIKMNNNAEAMAAKEIMIQEIMTKRFEDNYSDEHYKFVIDGLTVEENEIRTAEYRGYYIPEDMMTVMKELLTAVATKLSNAKFMATVISDSCYSEGYIEAKYENGILDYEATLTGVDNNWGEIICEECGETICRYDDYDPSKIYICEECGEEIVITEKMIEAATPWTVKEIIEIK